MSGKLSSELNEGSYSTEECILNTWLVAYFIEIFQGFFMKCYNIISPHHTIPIP